MSPTPTDLDDRWVAALRDPGAEPDLDAAWAAVQERVSAPRQERVVDRRRWAVLAAAAVLVVAVVAVWRTGATGPDDEGLRTDDPPAVEVEEWERMPDMPLPTRTNEITFAIGDEVFVVGGSPEVCELPGCTGARGDLTDGAALDVSTGTWRVLAPVPEAFTALDPTVVDGAAYVLATTETGRTPMMRYDPGPDTWTEIPPPVEGGLESWSLAAMGDRLVAIHRFGTTMGEPDRIFDPVGSTWAPLPDPPPPDDAPPGGRRDARATIAFDGGLLRLEVQPDAALGDDSPLVASLLDGATGRWESLPDVAVDAERAWGPWLDEGGQLVSLPDGVVLDVDDRTWSTLPDRAGDTVGLVGDTGAAYDFPVIRGGSVFDLATRRWTGVPVLPGVGGEDRDDRPFVTVGRDVVVVGGARYGEDIGAETPDPVFLAETWIWRAPPPG